jgi:2-oxoglutarate dehydrogenase E2 component (dihydrolipoamide succinyltransferase)
VPIELKVPSVGESVTEVQVGDWLKSVGDPIARDEVLVMLETDKVTVELPAPTAGTLSKILVKKGDSARVGQVVAHLEEGAVAAAAPAKAAAAPAASAAAPASAAGGDSRVMPAAARALHEAGLLASDVAASGPGGRLLKEDVARALAAPPAPRVVASIPVTASVARPALPPAPTPARSEGARQEEIVAMTPMRRRIAERLVEAQQTAALLTTFNEVDMTAVKDLRTQYQDAFTKQYQVKLGFMSFFVKAAVDALKAFPAVNAEVRGTDIVYRNYCDVGVAVGGGKGLVVPVLRNAERMSFSEIEKQVGEYGKRAQAGTLKLEELQGGTFTITNGGVYGSLLSTPIINPPQSGILGLHGIVDRPVALNGQVVIRSMMYIALTYDHRVVDGREAVSFLKRIKDTIEQPARLLLEV